MEGACFKRNTAEWRADLTLPVCYGGASELNRRTFQKLVSAVTIDALSADFSALAHEVDVKPAERASGKGETPERDWKSGQDSPAHDCDRLYSIGEKRIVLENSAAYVAFDQHTGALVELRNSSNNWKWQHSPTLAESFRLFAPTPDRSYNPVLGARNPLASFARSSDGQSVVLTWTALESEYEGRLNITLRGEASLEGGTVQFKLTVVNGCPFPISSASWPILGSATELNQQTNLHSLQFGNMIVSPLVDPSFRTVGYFGTNYPTTLVGGRFILLSSADQGLYVASHDHGGESVVKYLFELKPGYENSWDCLTSEAAAVSGHPVRCSMEAVHFPFVNPGESRVLAPVVLAPYSGDWHTGVEIYKRWRATWFRPSPMPEWVTKVHSWQQLQINSSEDDLRTRYVDLPKRMKQAVERGITAVQLVGWTKGGQDRGNPSNDTDARLGTTEEFKEAIKQLQVMGIHVVLFAKYPWADITTEWYKTQLYRYMATDPFGNIYSGGGYKYQTPEQLAGINIRRFAAACTSDVRWRDIASHEFQKLLDLGGSGFLYDEVEQHQGVEFCFSNGHAHHVPATLWSGDIALARRLRQMASESIGESSFLFAGEAPEDIIEEFYSLTYFRISPGHIPVERYVSPFRPVMIAVTGFDDREMINRALMYRYILSYEPFNFKGNLDDFPLTIAYGKAVDALRARYSDYLWNAEFRDTLEATVSVSGRQYRDYSVFRRENGLRAIVLTNENPKQSVEATVTIHHQVSRRVVSATPEKPDAVAYNASITIPPRSAAVLMEE